MSEPKSFDCPSCGSPLTIHGAESEIRCSYCGNTIAIPAEMRELSQTIDVEPIVTQIEAMRGGLFRQFEIGAALWIGGFAIIFALIIFATLIFQSKAFQNPTSFSATATLRATATPRSTATPRATITPRRSSMFLDLNSAETDSFFLLTLP